MKATHTGMIIVGGGLMKHHICNANLMVTLLISISVFKIKCKLNQKINFWNIRGFRSKFFRFQRNGADFSIFLNTSSEFDGSDSGARPDEAVSWGKIKMDATPVKVKLFCIDKKIGIFFYLRYRFMGKQA